MVGTGLKYWLDLRGGTRGDVRGLRTDRITSLRVTDITFTPTHPHDVETDLHRWTTQPMQIP